MANILLDIPDRLSWASGASRIVDPVTAGYTLATGYDYSQRPPPKTENYFRAQQFAMYDMMLMKTFSSFRPNVSATLTAATASFAFILYNPANDRWLLGDNFNNAVYYSGSGTSWSAGVVPGQPIPSTGKFAIVTTTDGFCYSALNAPFIEHSSDGITWPAPVAATANSFLANRGTDDFFLEIENTPNVWIWATGITGGRVAATTPPASLDYQTSTACGGDSQTDWYITSGSTAYVSTDSADTWASTGGSLSSVAPAANSYADADYHDGTWVVVGNDGAGPPYQATIDYSTNEGVTWSTATIHDVGFGGVTSTSLMRVKALGNDMWVAVGTGDAIGYNGPFALISMDDGVNWYRALVTSDDPGSVVSVSDITCNGNQLGIAGTYQVVAFTDRLYNIF